MRILILGGATSGKSDFAQELALALAGTGKRYYVATMIPADDEDRAKIRSHLRRRDGMEFETVEQGRHICECLERTDPEGTFLLDSLTSLLTNELFPREKNYMQDTESAEQCRKDMLELTDRMENLVIVADNFRRFLGEICCELAGKCDTVLEMSCGNLTIHKGELPK